MGSKLTEINGSFVSWTDIARNSILYKTYPMDYPMRCGVYFNRAGDRPVEFQPKVGKGQGQTPVIFPTNGISRSILMAYSLRVIWNMIQFTKIHENDELWARASGNSVALRWHLNK